MKIHTVKEFELNGVVHKFNSRHDVVKIVKSSGVGIELGTAGGDFSKRVLEISDLEYLYTVDRFDPDAGRYKAAMYNLLHYRSRSAILKMEFSEAVELFSDRYFDWIYIDGYAHTGQENGQTFVDWWDKIKTPGIFSGDDYDPEIWPLVVENLNQFAEKVQRDIYVIDCKPGDDWASKSSTWFMMR
jgi:hypothetical protein